MVAERRPLAIITVLRADTREQLVEHFGLQEEDFVDSQGKPNFKESDLFDLFINQRLYSYVYCYQFYSSGLS